MDVNQLYRQTKYLEKMQTRAYTIDDLVGACGGYIGLFLGYALLQLPSFINFVFHAIKRKNITRMAQHHELQQYSSLA